MNRRGREKDRKVFCWHRVLNPKPLVVLLTKGCRLSLHGFCHFKVTMNQRDPQSIDPEILWIYADTQSPNKLSLGGLLPPQLLQGRNLYNFMYIKEGLRAVQNTFQVLPYNSKKVIEEVDNYLQMIFCKFSKTFITFKALYFKILQKNTFFYRLGFKSIVLFVLQYTIYLFRNKCQSQSRFFVRLFSNTTPGTFMFRVVSNNQYMYQVVTTSVRKLARFVSRICI